MENSNFTNSCFVDTLTFSLKSIDDFTFSVENDSDLEFYLGFLASFLKPLGLSIGDRLNGGRNFYKYSYQIVYHSSVKEENDQPVESLGFLAIGGNSDTSCFYFTGFCCEYLNMNSLMPVVYDLLVKHEAKITRCDTAFDDFDGFHSVVDVKDWYFSGCFTTKGGSPKIYSSAGCWLDPDPSNQHSRTFYVGSRKSTKFYRCYEKGHQQGDLDSNWVRHEIEWKSNNKAVIPLDILIYPGRYLSEAYDCLYWIPDDDESGLSSGVTYAIKSKVKMSKEHYESYARLQYGKVLNVLNEGFGMSKEDIFDCLSRQGIPDRLFVPQALPFSFGQSDDLPF